MPVFVGGPADRTSSVGTTSPWRARGAQPGRERPIRQATFTATGLTASYAGGATAFALAVDSGTAVGNAAQLRVSYDLTGNGSWDRVETYRYFATDPVAGAETYTQRVGLLSSERNARGPGQWLGQGRDLERADRRRGQPGRPSGEFLGDTAVLVGCFRRSVSGCHGDSSVRDGR